MSVKDIAYKIAVALQKKFPAYTLGVRVETLKSDRLLFEYTLGTETEVVAQTAYSEGFFEDLDKDKVNWLANRIYTELKQREEWTNRKKPG